jgi:hypothetical protein
MFPLAVDVGDKLSILVFDSNHESSNIVTNAFGRVSPSSLEKVAAIVADRPERDWVFALHHHVALPKSVSARTAKGRITERFMVLENPTAFLRSLAPHPAVILHGHRHVEYLGRIGNVDISSARSAAVGDEVGDVDPRPGFRILGLSVGSHGRCALDAVEDFF